MDPADLETFSGRAPLFPLPNVVLFPRTVLPLHVFEPRYRAMTERALRGERLIAMALLKPGWEPHVQGSPPIFETVGLGRIVQEQRLPDGRYNLALLGVARARILDEETTSAGYRLASLKLLGVGEPDDPRLEQVRLGLLAVYATLASRVIKSPGTPDPDMSLGLLCDLLTAFLETDVAAKQAVFEELDVAARAAKVVEMLKRAPAAGIAVKSGLKPGGRWPPDPNPN